MSIDTDIDYFRARQAEQFTTTATVTRGAVDLSDPASTDPTTGDVDSDTEPVYEGPCKIRPGETVGSDAQAGERRVRLTGFVGKFPVDTDLHVGDTVTVTASAHDAGLVDQSFVVTDVLVDEWQIARVVTLELGPGLQTEAGS